MNFTEEQFFIYMWRPLHFSLLAYVVISIQMLFSRIGSIVSMGGCWRSRRPSNMWGCWRPPTSSCCMVALEITIHAAMICLVRVADRTPTLRPRASISPRQAPTTFPPLTLAPSPATSTPTSLTSSPPPTAKHLFSLFPCLGSVASVTGVGSANQVPGNVAEGLEMFGERAL